MNYLLYIIVLAVFLVIGTVLYFTVKRNYFNKYKYIRLVKYNDNMTVSVSYIKKENFNTNNSLLINSKHIYDFKGYKTIVTTSNASESINPLDFESKYDVKDFKSAIRSKIISETFDTLKADKFDKIMMLLLLNAIQLVAIAYLLYNALGTV